MNFDALCHHQLKSLTDHPYYKAKEMKSPKLHCRICKEQVFYYCKGCSDANDAEGSKIYAVHGPHHERMCYFEHVFAERKHLVHSHPNPQQSTEAPSEDERRPTRAERKRKRAENDEDDDYFD